MYGANAGEWFLTGSSCRWGMRLAAVAALGLAFALGGCGRKGPLDPPPSAAIAPSPTDQPSLGETNDPNMTGFNRPPPRTAAPAAPPVPPDKRSFLLDFLIK
jgi:predicted small lipoprotein YifL